MKMYDVENIDGFFDTVNKCEGKVELVTDSGIYNLKSKMSQIVACAKAFSNGCIRELELRFSNTEDCMKMTRFCTGQYM